MLQRLMLRLRNSAMAPLFPFLLGAYFLMILPTAMIYSDTLRVVALIYPDPAGYYAAAGITLGAGLMGMLWSILKRDRDPDSAGFRVGTSILGVQHLVILVVGYARKIREAANPISVLYPYYGGNFSEVFENICHYAAALVVMLLVDLLLTCILGWLTIPINRARK